MRKVRPLTVSSHYVRTKKDRFSKACLTLSKIKDQATKNDYETNIESNLFRYNTYVVANRFDDGPRKCTLSYTYSLSLTHTHTRRTTSGHRHDG